MKTELQLPTDSERERLAILAEECAEVQQIIMKILRHGYESYNPFDKEKRSNRKLLQKELGDLTYAIQMLESNKDVENHMIFVYANAKQESIAKYLHFNNPVEL